MNQATENIEKELAAEKGLQLTTAPSIELATVIQSSGLEVQRAQDITNKYLPFLQKIAEIEALTKRVDFENPTELDEKICRELRLQLVPNRTGCDKFKKAQKAEFALINGLNDNCYGIVEKTSKLLENKLEAVEKARAIKEEQKATELKATRLEQIKPYLENADIYPLGTMSESSFEDLLNGSKLAKEQRLAAEKKALDDKLAAELADKAEKEKLRLENERLQQEAAKKKIEDAEAKAIIDRKNKEIQDAADAKVKEAEAKTKEAKDKADAEAKLAQAEAAALKKKQDAEKEELEKKLAKAEAEMKSKKEAEAKAAEQMKKDAAIKEQEARFAAEKAAKAPDKEKLKEWVNKIMIPITPSVGADAHKMALDIHVKFEGFKKWANSQIDSL